MKRLAVLTASLSLAGCISVVPGPAGFVSILKPFVDAACGFSVPQTAVQAVVSSMGIPLNSVTEAVVISVADRACGASSLKARVAYQVLKDRGLRRH